MTFRQILPIQDPRLRLTSLEVDLSNGVPPEVATLAQDMLETSRAVDGAGMAAIQIGVSLRVFVMDLHKVGGDTIVFINPEVENASEERFVRKEGCLSMPGIFLEIDRPAEVTYRYIGLDGEEHTYTGTGFAAICMQHEMDHLNGVRHLDHLSPLKRERALKKFGIDVGAKRRLR